MVEDPTIVINEEASRVWTGLVQEEQRCTVLRRGASAETVRCPRNLRPALLPLTGVVVTALVATAPDCEERIERDAWRRNHAAVSSYEEVAAGFEYVHVGLKRDAVVVAQLTLAIDKERASEAGGFCVELLVLCMVRERAGPVETVRRTVKIQLRKDTAPDLLEGCWREKRLVRCQADDVVAVEAGRIIYSGDGAVECAGIGTVAIFEVADLVGESDVVGMSGPGDPCVQLVEFG